MNTELTDHEGASAEPGSPVMAQYRALKAAHPGCLLFFRMGDFYELFWEDAVAAAQALDIALTRRGKDAGELIPMCGVPAHSAEPYLHRLIRQGFKVAIADQLESPAEAKRRPGKTLLRRAVVRVVTSGTLTEDGLLEPGRHNYLAALARAQGAWACAWVDVSTGDFRTEAVDGNGLGALLARLDPGELLLPERLAADEAIRAQLADWRARTTAVRDASFDSTAAERRLASFFQVAVLDGMATFGRAEVAAAGALLDYLELTQKGALPRLRRPRQVQPDGLLRLDPATRRNLELTQSLQGGRDGSLLAAIDRTRTAAGARLLAERVAAPLARAAAIRDRLDTVDAYLADTERREPTRALLRGVPDLERALSRLALGRGGPRDLLAVAQALARADGLRTLLADAAPPLAAAAAAIPPQESLRQRLESTIDSDPPLLARDGGFIRAGACAELDSLRTLRDEARGHMLALEARYRDQSGIASLKIRHNNQLGWYIEVTATHRAKVPEGFVQRQSMAGATRYTTQDLGLLEGRVATAADRALELELSLLAELVAAVLAESDALAASAQAMAELDVASSLADLAREQRWIRPVVDERQRIDIRAGRHPVVEPALQRSHQSFVANDLLLDQERRLWLLTGPNMAGKSTFLRQCTLIVLLAQAGSFVPAESAAIGVVDRLFSRVGAADDLARGRSTFMVEMVETATILNQATARSFVILDEIGRGTATWDGLSLAWAVVEQLHEANRCLGLFATHYHELTALTARLTALAPHTVRVKEWQNEVVFLHEVAPGTADRSYGIHVARLAGLPPVVIRRAEEVLRRLEEGEPRSAAARLADDLPLFAAALEQAATQAKAEPMAPSAVEAELRSLDLDDLTPRQALDLLYRLKAAASD